MWIERTFYRFRYQPACCLRLSARFGHRFLDVFHLKRGWRIFQPVGVQRRKSGGLENDEESRPMDRAERQSQSETLSAALRLIRTHRRMKTAEIAQAMGMALRSYEHFESGGGRVNLERIHRFAEATDSDAYAILAALALGSPEFALRTADNKLMTILMVALQEFDAEVGDVLGELDARTIINTFTKALKDLALQSVRRDSAANAWLQQRLGKLVAPGDGEDGGSSGNSTP